MSIKKTFFINLSIFFSILGIIGSSIIVVATYKFGLERVSRYAFTALGRIKGDSEHKDRVLQYTKELNSTSISTKYFPAYNWNPALHGLGEGVWISRPSNVYIVRKNEGSGIIPFKTNKLGHRSTLNENLNKPIDVVFIGDSFTEGCCVSTGNTAPDYYAKMSKKNIINLGISGTGPLRQLVTLIEFVQLVKSDSEISFSEDTKIIWNVFTGNDLHDLSKEKSSPLNRYMIEENYNTNYYSKLKSITKSQKLFLTKILVDSTSTNNAMMEYYNYGNTINQSLIPLNILDFDKIIRKIIQICSAHNLDLEIILISDYPDTPINSLSGQTNQSLKSKFKEFDSVKIHEYSLKKYLPRKLENDPLGRTYGHFDEKGYESLAKFIFKSTSLK